MLFLCRHHRRVSSFGFPPISQLYTVLYNPLYSLYSPTLSHSFPLFWTILYYFYSIFFLHLSIAPFDGPRPWSHLVISVPPSSTGSFQATLQLSWNTSDTLQNCGATGLSKQNRPSVKGQYHKIFDIYFIKKILQYQGKYLRENEKKFTIT